MHAQHDKELLAPRLASSRQIQEVPTKREICTRVSTPQMPLPSNVCCQDMESIALSSMNSKLNIPPPHQNIDLKIAILTVSDRAAANSYITGDLSGPAVKAAVVRQINEINTKAGEERITLSNVKMRIVPDELDEIKKVLLGWSIKNQSETSYDIIFTTGGTGFSVRDITPEATLSVLDRECHGLMCWAGIELTQRQPLATLSRATAGVCGNTIIVNLPGSPSGAGEVVEVLFPLLLYAARDVNSVIL